jgi:hypothetical protein
MHKFTVTTNHLALKAMIISLSFILCLAALYAQQTTSTPDDFQSLHAQSEVKAHTEIEKKMKEAEDQAEQALIREAVEVIEDTKKAITALNQKQDKEALDILTRATGKIDILLDSYPQEALLPVNFKIKVIETAPQKIESIKQISKIAENAMKNKNYPHTRLLLDILRSEINIRTYNLPLAFYPTALKKAARAVEQQKADEAINILGTALNTLVVINQIVPLPVIKAKIMLTAAEEQHQKAKDVALKLIRKARYEMELAKELGYTGGDETYTTLKKAIDDLEKQVKSNIVKSSTFANLKEKMGTFLKRLSDLKHQSHKPEKE